MLAWLACVNLAGSANLLEGLYILPMLYLFIYLFSPLGKPADRAIYLPSIISYFLTWVKLSHDVLDQFSPSFHQMKGICVNFLDPYLFFITLGTLPWQPIWGKICKVTFIQHAGISQQIWISQFRVGNPLTLGNFCIPQNWPSSLFALAFPKNATSLCKCTD